MNTDLLLPASTTAAIPAPRLYGPLDPYFYTVDNRPLQDLDTNLRALVDSPIAALFRAVGINDRLLNPLAMGAIKPPVAGGVGTYCGLDIGLPGTGTVTVGVGALFFKDSINVSNSTLVTKMAAVPVVRTLATPAPSTTGQSINYLIEGAVSFLDASSMPSSSVPFVDAANTLLPGLLANAELKLSVKAGTASATGSQTTPAATVGSYPLFVITVPNSGVPTVSAPTGAPTLTSSIRIRPEVSFPTSGYAGTAVLQGSSIPEFADAQTQSANIQITLDPAKIDPTKALKLTLSLASTAAGNNAVFSGSYKVVSAGYVTTSAAVSTSNDVIAMGAANTVTETVTTNISIPPSAFAGWVGAVGSQVWTLNCSRIYLQLTRNGTNGSDTNTGAVSLVDVAVTQ